MDFSLNVVKGKHHQEFAFSQEDRAMAIDVHTLPETLPATLPCQTLGYLALFYATADGSSKDPSDVGRSAAEDKANRHEPEMVKAVLEQASKWRPECEGDCASHIWILSNDEKTRSHEVQNQRTKENIGWEATLTVWALVAASCVHYPGG
jgi:hypothetical protein